jgi:type IV fimbrial biogenesis protein FimT
VFHEPTAAANRMPVRIKSNAAGLLLPLVGARYRLSDYLLQISERAYIVFMNYRKQYGFTLYEILITVVIMSIILTLGIPNLSEFVKNSRITNTVNDLHSTFPLARSEAARAKAPITICASADALSADPGCGGTFDQGWIVFLDLDGDTVRAGAGETLLRASGPVATGVSITVNGNATYFAFAATGMGRGDVVGTSFSTAMICDDRGLVPGGGGRATARRLVATPIGRATVISDLALIQAAGGVCP